MKQMAEKERPADPVACLKIGCSGWLAALLIFVFSRYLGADGVGAHLISMALSGPLILWFVYRYRAAAGTGLEITLPLLGRALVAGAVSASFQGAVYEHLLRTVAEAPYLSFLPAALGGVISMQILAMVYVYPGWTGGAGAAVRGQVALAFCAAAAGLRLVYLGLPELMEQEAYYWNYAQHPALSYLDHPPMVAALIWEGTKLFGVTELGVRVGAFCCWFVTAFMSYRLTRRIFGTQAAVGTLMLLGVLPFYYGVGFLMTPDAPLLAAWSSLLYFSYRALVEGNTMSWLGVGASFGLGMLSKYTIALLGPGLLLYMLIDRRARARLLTPAPYAAALIALLLFSPVIVWNMQHEWVSFLFQSARRVAADPVFSTPRLIGHLTLMLTPAGVIGAALFLWRGNRIVKSAEVGNAAAVGPRLDRTYLLLVLLVVLPFVVFLVISITREVKLNWTSPIWLALMPFLGWSVSASGCRLCPSGLKVMQVLWRFTVPLLITAIAVGMHYVTLGLPFVPHPPGPFLIGWRGLAGEVEGIVEARERETGSRPIVVGMDHYQIASGLAFYRASIHRGDEAPTATSRADETVGWHVFGRNARMYGWWFDPGELGGREMIAVATQEYRLEREFFEEGVVFDSDIRPLIARKDGQEVRRFYYRLVSSTAHSAPSAGLKPAQ
jgi:dolichol-phosphate mannosyltransferase